MSPLDLKTTLQAHIKMWDWLSLHPSKEKADYFKGHSEVPLSGCFLCEYDMQQRKLHEITSPCYFCPIWNTMYGCNGGAYGTWAISKGPRRAGAASEIADLGRAALEELE